MQFRFTFDYCLIICSNVVLHLNGYLDNVATFIVLCIDEGTFLKPSPLSGEERTEKRAVNQQSSSEVPNQERGASAVSKGQEKRHKEVPSPSSEETFPQNLSYQSAKEEPATPDGAGSQDSGRSQITLTLTALLSHRSGGEVCVGESPPTVPDVSADRLSDLSHLQHTVESSESHQSESQSEAAVAADAECYKSEENTDVISVSSAAAAASAHEQEDVQPNWENGLSDETDVCVHQGI